MRVSLKRAHALLAYLALEGRPVPRDHLALLLWPEASQEIGRTHHFVEVDSLDCRLEQITAAVNCRHAVGLHRPIETTTADAAPALGKDPQLELLELQI